jgi:RNA recognition motif-containing protein
MNLFVAGLPYDVDDAELEEIFEKFGPVVSAKIAIDRETGKSRGFGFVSMQNEEDGKQAIELLNDIHFMFTDIQIHKGHIDCECIICYENHKNMIILNCFNSHITCSSCLKKWTSNNNTCPMCRNQIILNKSILHVN